MTEERNALRRVYQLLLEQHALLRRRIYMASAERIDVTQLARVEGCAAFLSLDDLERLACVDCADAAIRRSRAGARRPSRARSPSAPAARPSMSTHTRPRNGRATIRPSRCRARAIRTRSAAQRCAGRGGAARDRWPAADEAGGRRRTQTEGLYEGVDRTNGKPKWTASPFDLVFGSHSELRAISETYAAEDGKQKLAQDFVKAWSKVMMLDRFDVNTP